MGVTLHLIVTVSLYVGFATGVIVLAVGDWRKFTLKYAGVALSTGSALYMLALGYTHPDIWNCRLKEFLCDEGDIFYAMRNAALIVFHVTSGRDAIRFKKCDRRGCLNTGERRLQASRRRKR
jgi:hypothetical protein